VALAEAARRRCQLRPPLVYHHALQAGRSPADGACQATTRRPRPPFDPTTAPSWPGRATTQAVPTRRHHPLRRPGIPITRRDHRACHIPAISCLGASRTPFAAVPHHRADVRQTCT
jgi:hypothetical protein